MPPKFYFDQQALITKLAQGKQWTWSTARPHGICGFAIGNPMNLVMVIAVYATLSKALGLPLRHPGSRRNGEVIYNVTDTSLLARACVWMASDPRCANEPFNVTNRDVFRWENMWSHFADYFDMDLAQPQKITLTDMMADKSGLWSELVQQHGLIEIPYDQLVGWGSGDFGDDWRRGCPPIRSARIVSAMIIGRFKLYDCVAEFYHSSPSPCGRCWGRSGLPEGRF